MARLERQHQWKQLVMRDGVAAPRAITEQHDDRLLRDLGLEKRKQPKRREPPKTVRVELLVNSESQVDPFACAERANCSGPAVAQPPPAVVHLPVPPDVQELAPAVVQGGLYKGNRTFVHRSGAAVHGSQHGAQVTADEADEAAEGSPSLKALETTREEADPSSSAVSVKEEEPNPVQQQSSTTTTRTPTPESEAGPPSEANPSQKYASDRDELVALIKQTTGRQPDLGMIRNICEKVELRGWTLRQYLDDITPRIPRLSMPPGEGFFVWHARNVGGAATEAAPEPETIEQKAERTGPCKKCKGFGKVKDVYCTCRMGLDLERVEKRPAQNSPDAAAGA